MNSRQKVVIKAAIKRGVPRTKDITSGIQEGVGSLMRQVSRASEQGGNPNSPATDVYNAADLYKLAQGSRSLLMRVQNLPDGFLKDKVGGSLNRANAGLNKLSAKLGQRTAGEARWQLQSISLTLEDADKWLANHRVIIERRRLTNVTS